MSDGNVLDDAISRVSDEAVRAVLAREVERLRGSRRFGLVFDRHMPEAVRLPAHPVRKGVTVGRRDESDRTTWRVTGFADSTRKVAELSDGGGDAPVDELVVIREFGEPVYPGLVSRQRVEQAPEGAPWHAVINGENYHVLQALRTTHRREVDLIYIDPPYNTGNDSWIYNDRYVDGNDRTRSSKWLSFLERRLLIARDLLKPTGVIFVAIGDDEHHRLRMLLDQVFGPENFLSNVVWQGGRKNDSRYVSNGADYMLVYARNEAALRSADVRWRERKPGAEEALAAAEAIWGDSDGDHAEATKQWRAWLKALKASASDASDAVTRFNTLSDTGRPMRTDGNLTSPNPRTNLQYDLLHPKTGMPVRRHPNGWRYSRETMDRLLAAGRVFFGPDETSTASGIVYLDEMDRQVAESVFVRDRNASGERLKQVLGDKRFPYPKDHEVLMRWIGLAAPDDAIVLDFFGGSGTTAEAVMRLNAEDGGTRQCLLVTNNEVGPKQAKALRKAGHHPGDPEWAAQGVFENVTRPRLTTVATGSRPDGTGFGDPLPANIEFFDLAYLDPGQVRRGREFAAIASLLWLEAGGTGDRIDEVPDDGWAMTAHHGVLFDVEQLVPFAAAASHASRDGRPLRVAFVVTDSPAEYQHAVERLPAGLRTAQLYEDYLTNYTINTDGGGRR